MDYKELEKYIKKLFNDYLNKYGLNYDDKNDVIQNTMFQLYKKEMDGTLVGDVQTNKNYIFITLRNYVFQSMKSRIRKFETLDSIEIPSNDLNTLDLLDSKHKVDIILTLLEKHSFKEIDKKIINTILIGNSASFLSKETGLNELDLNKKYSSMKQKLKKILYENNIKYKIIYSDRTIYCKTEKELLQQVDISITHWNNYKKLGKFIFPNYRIEII